MCIIVLAAVSGVPFSVVRTNTRERTTTIASKRLEELLEEVAECHLIDLLAFAVLDNHFHVLLRNRPDLKRKLTPSSVARRWLLLHPKRRDDKGKACEPTRRASDDPGLALGCKKVGVVW